MDSKHQLIASGQIVQIKHQKTNAYLFSDNVLLDRPILIQTDEKFVVGGSQSVDMNTLWQVIRCEPVANVQDHIKLDNSTLLLDDFVLLRHYITSRFLSFAMESQTTRQGEACCLDKCLLDGTQTFMLQRTKNTPELRSGSVIRITNARFNSCLHTHKSKFKQGSISGLQEVTGFSGRDENDLWIIQIPSEDLKNRYKLVADPQLQPRPQSFVRHQDLVIIRSAKTGGTLHSHARLKNSGFQEITYWRAQPRDENDWWKVLIYQEDENQVQKNNKLLVGSVVTLQHKGTGRFLSTSDGEVGGREGMRTMEWCIVGNEMPQDAVIPKNISFHIMHLPSKKYLSTTDNHAKISTSQWEVVLSDSQKYETLWQIEQIDSIFV